MNNGPQIFYQKINQNKDFIGEKFDFENYILKITSLKSNVYISFENCTFNCQHLIFQYFNKPRLCLEFKNCTFNCDVSFLKCDFQELLFINTKSIKSLTIEGQSEKNSILNVFQFSNDSNNEIPKLNTNFYIRNVQIKDTFSFEYVNHIKGKFNFLENKLGDKEKNRGQFIFNHSNFYNAFFSTNSFNELTSFYNTNFSFDLEYLTSTGAGYECTFFYKNTFEKLNFSNSNFIGKCKFDKCDFLSTTWFENCENMSHSYLKFIACEFKGFSLFNKSQINYLDIDRCTFNKSSSFTDSVFNTLKLFEVKFGGGAYFDEMKINKVLDKSYLKDRSKILEWKRTLRAIKQESQKTENRIDFNRFRAYELAAHYEELNWKWNSGFIDKSILFLTKISTDYGNSWRKALRFIIVGGFSIYITLFTVENHNLLIDVSNWDNWARLFSGFFRFLLVTDFYNPLETDRIYLTNPFSWLIFIFGKIFIAFGIYEMIQSFRKFKA